MDRSQKADLVAELKNVFNETGLVVITRNHGLSVAQSTDLRLKMRDAGAQFKVAKNRLAKIALEGTRYGSIGEMLVGPTALATSVDPVAAARVAVEFAKSNDRLEIVGGAMGETLLDVNGIKALAELPSLDQIYLADSRYAPYGDRTEDEIVRRATSCSDFLVQRGARAQVRSAARLANRLADAWYRQLVSWSWEARGYVVLYDRHFALDFAPEIAADAGEPLDRRVYRWCLTHLYPTPDLVIFLDAPGAVLWERKRESTVEELERRRQAFLAQGRRLRGFRRVDATRPLPEVFDEVRRVVAGHFGRAAAPSAERVAP